MSVLGFYGSLLIYRMNHFFQNLSGFSSESDQLVLLKYMMPLLKEKPSIAEIGVFHGRGTAMWIVELINAGISFEYYAIDNFKPVKLSHYPIATYEKTMANLEPVKNYFHLITEDSVVAANIFNDNSLDIVYIDATHDYNSVKNDIIAWLPKVKNGGFLCGDDYISGWPGVVQAVNDNIPKPIKIGTQQWLYQVN